MGTRAGPPIPFPWDYSRLDKAIRYTLENYDTYGWNVSLTPASSYNVPIIPGINISAEAFWGPFENAAIVDLIHEAMHDIIMYGPRHGPGISHIVPTVNTPLGTDMWTQYIDFLQAARCDGKSLWTRIREVAGPRPEVPKVPGQR